LAFGQPGHLVDLPYPLPNCSFIKPPDKDLLT
jgi:hypothetical protein